MGKNVTIGLLLAALVYFSRDNLLAAIQRGLRFGKPSFSNYSIRGGIFSMDISLPVSNDYPVGVPIERFDGTITLDDTVISNIVIGDPLVITPRNTTNVQIDVRRPLVELPGLALQLATSGVPTSMRIRGQALVQGKVIEIDQPLIQLGSV